MGTHFPDRGFPFHQFAILTNDWKLIEAAPDGLKELYDLGADPGELSNIIAEAPDVAEQFRSLAQPYIHAWFGDNKEAIPAISKETLERLRALGYF